MSESERKAAPAAATGARADAARAASAEGAAGQAVQAGVMLRQMRQAAGVDPLLLASALKVTLQKIQALEAGRLDDLPGLTFARGLAAAVCRYFATDPEPVLALMPTVVPGLSGGGDASRDSFGPSGAHAGGGADLPHQRAGTPGWLLGLVAVLLIGALVVWLVPEQRLSALRPQTAGSVQQAALDASAADDAAATTPAPVAPAASESASDSEIALASAADTAVPAVAPTVPPVPDQAASAAPVVGASAPAAGQDSSGPVQDQDQDVVTFNATSPVWVGVHDGSGKPILNRTLNAGDTLGVSGQLPLTVTVGDKTAVTVLVRGQPFDLNQHIRKGIVARFTVDAADNP